MSLEDENTSEEERNDDQVEDQEIELEREDDENVAVVEEPEEIEGEQEETPPVVIEQAARGPAVSPETLHSVAARENLRQQLANDVEAFLKRGGEIENVPINVRADPPKKPENNYGRGSI